MIRFFYIWVVGLTLAAYGLNVTSFLYLSVEGGSQTLSLSLTAQPACPDTQRDGLFAEPVAIPPALSLSYARQGKQNLGLAHPVALMPQVREHRYPPQPLLIPTFPPWRFFAPRKLIPAPAEDEPF